MVGHTLSYTVSNFKVNQTYGSWDISIFVSFPCFSQSDHYQTCTWDMVSELTHNNSSPSLPRPQLTPLLVCWQLGQHPSACPSMTGIPKMPITPLYFAIPWRTGSSSPHPARQWGPPQICFCSLGNQIPGDACTMDAYRQQRGTESDQGESFCLPQPNTTGNDTQCQHPCASWRSWRDCGQAGRGPPRSCHTHQDTDGLLQDDQWWALGAQTALPYHPCILPWGKGPRKTYGQAIQDTLQQSG